MMSIIQRGRRRNLVRPPSRTLRLMAALLAALLIALCVLFFIRAERSQDRLADLSIYIARNIRTDVNQALQALDTIKSKGSTASGDALSVMKRSIYAAYRQNMCLIVARGDSYSLIDSANYNAFQAAVTEYERLLANGQSTAQPLKTMDEYLRGLENAILARFDSRDRLLPKTGAPKINR